ncbi:MAG: bifunctional transcriptional activator/DNA repair enzyme AdaA [Gemmatimonadales bacterium]
MSPDSRRLPRAEVCERALNARDPRFDGIFFVGITTTRVYCRPVCPARVSYTDRRRFFDSAASAERAGFRPCMRCRPELAPGRAPMDAVPRLARVAADRIAAGALNGRSVAELASELGVSERHLRRALERELGVSPVELAQTHRLLFAKQLLTETSLPITRIAFASGFQSLRRFNSVFRERYRIAPGELRRSASRRAAARAAPVEASGSVPELVSLTLSYRAPLAWEALLRSLTRSPLPAVETLAGRGYARTVRLLDRCGVMIVEESGPRPWRRTRAARAELTLHVSAALLPVLMPLLAKVRRLLDLDAEPLVIDAHLAQGGLRELVRRRPGLRIPGVLDGFEAVLREVLSGLDAAAGNGAAPIARVIEALGEPIDTGIPGLTRLAPTESRVAEVGVPGLLALGVAPRCARMLGAIARAMAEGRLRLEPGAARARQGLMEIEDVDAATATAIVMRAMHWPDAFSAGDRRLLEAAGLSGPRSLQALAERWRPWRAYAALHLLLAAENDHAALPIRGAARESARLSRPAGAAGPPLQEAR